MNRIAFVFTQALEPTAGGVQRSTWQLGHFFMSKGWEVFYISLAADGHQVPQQGTLISPPQTIRIGKLGWGSAKLVRFLSDTIRHVQPDIVINQTGVPVEPARALSSLKKRVKPFALVTCFHNNPAQIRENQPHIIRHLLRKSPALLWIFDHPIFWKGLLALHRLRNHVRFRRSFDRCDQFVVLSPTFVEELRWYVSDLPENKVCVIPNGFELPALSIEGPRKNWLLYVGRLEHAQKNVLLLPEVWQRLCISLSSWELHIVGDGPDKAELERRFCAMNAPRVFFHGRQKPDEFYRKSKIFLMLSAFEGFGNTLIEAQGFGVVPVAFRSYSAIDWMLNDGCDSLLVDAFNIERYAGAVLKLANPSDPESLEGFSRRAVENARRFSEDSVGQLWIALFDELMANTRERGTQPK